MHVAPYRREAWTLAWKSREPKCRQCLELKNPIPADGYDQVEKAVPPVSAVDARTEAV